jgi:tetratricopeptide (TPR) repeat protein
MGTSDNALIFSLPTRMRTTILPLLSAILLSATAFAQSNFEEGIRWYSQRSSGATGLDAKPEHINKAIPFFTKALEQGENELETGLYLMRSYIFKARFTLESNSDKRKTFQLAKEVGDELVAKYPLSKELRFEYLSALGQWGEVMGVFRAAKEGVVEKVKAEMEALIKLDPEFRKGVGERALAVLNLRVPKIPFILSWPDKKKSLRMTTNVINKYPNDIGNNFYHAEALVENGKDEEAISFLMRALAMQPDEEYLLEERSFHIQAKKMLDRLKN